MCILFFFFAFKLLMQINMLWYSWKAFVYYWESNLVNNKYNYFRMTFCQEHQLPWNIFLNPSSGKHSLWCSLPIFQSNILLFGDCIFHFWDQLLHAILFFTLHQVFLLWTVCRVCFSSRVWETHWSKTRGSWGTRGGCMLLVECITLWRENFAGMMFISHWNISKNVLKKYFLIQVVMIEV